MRVGVQQVVEGALDRNRAFRRIEESRIAMVGTYGTGGKDHDSDREHDAFHIAPFQEDHTLKM
jgi:hypothetical protein